MARDFFDTPSLHWQTRTEVSVDLMRELSQYSDADQMYRVFTRRIQQLYPTSRQLIISRRGFEKPMFRVTQFNQWISANNPLRDMDRLPVRAGGLLADLLYEDQPVIIDLLDLPGDDPAAEYLQGQSSLLAIPIYERGSAQSMVILGREDVAAFSRDQIPELIWMTNLFARAAESLVLSEQVQRLYETAAYEIRTVAELQQSLLPATIPENDRLDIAVHYQTAHHSGGDYYDFFPLGPHRLGFLVADVSGHGTPAAVLMAITHSLVHAQPDLQHEPSEFFDYLNKQLVKRYTHATGDFVTAFYGIVDLDLCTFSYSNAGHTTARFRAGSANNFHALEHARRLPLGVSARSNLHYPTHCIPFEIGDEIALYTDGIIEAINDDGEPFGVDRLDKILNQGAKSRSESIRKIIDEINLFAHPQLNSDDRTLLLLQRTEQSSTIPCCSMTAKH